MPLISRWGTESRTHPPLRLASAPRPLVLDSHRVTDSHRDFVCDDATKTGLFNFNCGAPPPPPPPPPVFGPGSLTSAVQPPAFGPGSLTSVVKPPAFGPTFLSPAVDPPDFGPTVLNATEVAPVFGPTILTSVVKPPAFGPTLLSPAIDPPDFGPGSLGATVVIPSTGPSSLGVSVNPPVEGPGSLDAVIAVIAAEFNISPYLGNSYDTEAEIFALQGTAPDGLVAYNESTHTLYIWVATQGLWHKFVWEFNIAPLEVSQDNFIKVAPIGNDNIKFTEDFDLLAIHDGTDWHRFNEE